MVQDCQVLSPDPYPLPFHSIRRISAPEDLDNGRQVYSGHAPAASVIALSDNDNVREYLMDAGRKKNKPTDVITAIRQTLRNVPQNFCVLNGGIVIVAKRVEIDEKQHVATLTSASIINGSQTQGELATYLSRCMAAGLDAFPVHVKFEIIETEDEDLIADVSIARNFMNNVSTISIVGRLGQLDELEARFQKAKPGTKLRKSETDRSEEHIGTEKLLQVIAALVPAELWPGLTIGDSPKKAYTYSGKTRCLKDFQAIHDRAKDPSAEGHQQAAELYKFYLDVCAEAWDLYNTWKKHQGFKGSGLRAIERDESGNIVDVPDGILFPILAALSAFTVRRNGRWTLRPPEIFSDAELIGAAKQSYMLAAGSNPQTMGKSEACYSSLYQLTSLYKRLGDLQP